MSVSVRVFWGENDICLGRLSKADCSPYVVGLVQSVESLHRTKRLSKWELLLPSCLKLGLELQLERESFWVSSLLAADLGTCQPPELCQ